MVSGDPAGLDAIVTQSTSGQGHGRATAAAPPPPVVPCMASKKRQVLRQYLPGNFPALSAEGLQGSIETQGPTNLWRSAWPC